MKKPPTKYKYLLGDTLIILLWVLVSFIAVDLFFH